MALRRGIESLGLKARNSGVGLGCSSKRWAELVPGEKSTKGHSVDPQLEYIGVIGNLTSPGSGGTFCSNCPVCTSPGPKVTGGKNG
jgi:hypothetical protein